MAGFELDLDLSADTRELTAHLQEVDGRVAKAVKRAVKKTMTWLRTHSAREIGRELNIKQKPLKQRFVVSQKDRAGTRYVNLWVGLLAIAAHDTGRARQSAAGVSVRGRQFGSAFLQRIYGSEEKVYIRASANRLRGHTTTSKTGRDWSRYSRPKSNFIDAEYGDRFPVQVVGINVEEVGRDVLERYERRINARYREILEQELNYALHVES